MNREQELLKRIEELEERLKEAERAELAIEAAGFDIWENNFVTGETYGTNRRCFLSLGYPEEELPQDLEETLRRIHPDDLKEGMKKVQAHFNGETDRYQAEMRARAKDGSWVWFVNYGRVIERDTEGNVTRFLGVTVNVDQRRLIEDEYRNLAYLDPLTALNNRRGFWMNGVSEVERAFRYHRPLSLLMADIDCFKDINDDYGHVAGDSVLCAVSAAISEATRQNDVKARWGGDEFVILLAETTLQEGAEIAERLRADVESRAMGVPGKVTLSMGIAALNAEDTLETLIKRADNALYGAKQNGKNRIVLSA